MSEDIKDTKTGVKKNFKPIPKGRTALSLLVGSAAAAMLFVLVPEEESGRRVKATVEEPVNNVNNVDMGITLEHISGSEYRTAYRDIVGVWTICDGDTYNVRAGQTATREECFDRLETQIINHARPVIACVPALQDPTRKNQLVASVSLAYNIGTNAFCGSTAARRFNAGRWTEGCNAFLLWNKAGGKVVRGLTLRRQREQAICLRGL